MTARELILRLVEALHEETVRGNDPSMRDDDPVEDTFRDCDHVWCEIAAEWLGEE